MSARRLRYELMLFATLGFECVVFSLLSFNLGRDAAGGARGWLPFFVVGALMLLINRLLIAYERWEEGGRLLSLGVALLIITLFLALAVAGPGTWGAALGGMLRLFSGTVPLSVLLVVAFAIWYRSILIAQSPATMDETGGRFGWSTLIAVFLLVEAASRDIHPPPTLMFSFFGSGLLAYSLARADRLTRVTEMGVITLPFTRRWLGALLGSLLFTMLVAIFVTLPFSLRGIELLYDLSAPVRYAVGWLLAGFIYLASFIVLPIFRFAFGNQEAIQLEPQGTPQPLATPAPVEALSGPLSTIIDLILIFFLITIATIILIYFYKLLMEAQRQRRESLNDAAGQFEQVEVEWDTSWWRRTVDRLRGLRPRRRYGVATVRDLYRNLLLFGDEHGLPRPAEDTPYEYVDPLVEHYPQRRADFLALTDAYVAAHYGEAHFPDEMLVTLREAWARISDEAPAESAD